MALCAFLLYGPSFPSSTSARYLRWKQEGKKQRKKRLRFRIFSHFSSFSFLAVLCSFWSSLFIISHDRSYSLAGMVPICLINTPEHSLPLLFWFSCTPVHLCLLCLSTALCRWLLLEMEGRSRSGHFPFPIQQQRAQSCPNRNQIKPVQYSQNDHKGASRSPTPLIWHE